MRMKFAAAAALVALALPAQASEVLLEAGNEVGGKLQIWSQPCAAVFKYLGSDPGFMITSSAGKGGAVIEGCAVWARSTVEFLVTWKDGARSVYPGRAFTIIEQPGKVKSARKSKRVNPM